MSISLKEVFLNKFHIENKAKFVPFSGYSMPINYDSGIIKEHLHVRKYVGVFDVSHMGQILIFISDANISKLEKFIPLNLKQLNINKSYYSFLLNSNGGIIDDIIISRIVFEEKEFFFIVYNSSRKENDEKIFTNNLSDYSFLNDNSLLAIQGPLAEKILSFIPNLKNLYFMNSMVINYSNEFIIISRSGYTGEDGFEISIPNNIIFDFINKIMENPNAKLCGLGSRDSLRLEAGLSLYGNELNEFITPIEANLTWAINKDRLNDKNLNGNQILLKQIQTGVNKFKIAFKPLSKSILRNKMKIYNYNNTEIGLITSGTYSPNLNHSIGIGYVNKNLEKDEKIYALIRNNLEELNIINLPFISHKYKKGK